MGIGFGQWRHTEKVFRPTVLTHTAYWRPLALILYLSGRPGKYLRGDAMGVGNEGTQRKRLSQPS